MADDETQTFPDGPGLTTGAVARRLGVAPTTLRSWERRYGIGPARRDAGRHRRWSPTDISVLERMCRLTSDGVPPAEAARQARAADSRAAAEAGGTGPGGGPAGRSSPGGPHALPLGSVRQECRGLANAAVRLDAPTLDALLESAVAEHGLVTAWEEVIMPALRAVGRKWATSDERYVEVEHLLSWHISSALRRLSTAGPPAAGGRPPVLLACAPEELHSLPLEALAAGLAEQGLPVLMFGAAVPAEALDEAVRRTGPAAVVLWSQSRGTANRALARRIRETAWGVRGARRRPSLLVAGPGWAGAGHLPGTVRPRGLREALEALVAISAGAAAPGADG